jgi:ubiquinone/menaquinone biosynthesis C-methylase UbiE
MSECKIDSINESYRENGSEEAGVKIAIKSDVLDAYDKQYVNDASKWRELGARNKAQNISKLCENYKYDRVLECGAGEGSLLSAADDLGVFSKLYAIEISTSGIDQINKRKISSLVEVKKFDGYKIPYPDDYFDLVYCSHVIEHVEHPRILLREIKRVSRRQIFEVPLDYKIGIDEDMEVCMKTGHINIYTPTIFKFLIRSEGFNILAELKEEVTTEIVRFNWYQNHKFKKTLRRELALKLMPIKSFIKQIVLGNKKFQEYENYTYSCLTEKGNELKIF